MTGERGRRRFLLVMLVLAIYFVVVGGLVWDYLGYRDDQADRACERSVETRSDARAMWLKTFDRVGDGDVVRLLRADLDELLPPLRCDDNVAVPVTE